MSIAGGGVVYPVAREGHSLSAWLCTRGLFQEGISEREKKNLILYLLREDTPTV